MNEEVLKIISKQIHLCNKCPILRRVTPNSMPCWYKSKNPQIFVVGLNPGLEWVKDEYNQKEEPQEEFYQRYLDTFLTSKFGSFLTKIFFSKEFIEQYIFFTNLIKCRKPRNISFTEKHFLNCKDYLIDQIKIVKPKVVVVFSESASKHYRVAEFLKPTLILKHPSYYRYNYESIDYMYDSEKLEDFLYKNKAHPENMVPIYNIEVKPLPDGTFF
jgi:uracil-DNA glycosylase family 4